MNTPDVTPSRDEMQTAGDDGSRAWRQSDWEPLHDETEAMHNAGRSWEQPDYAHPSVAADSDPARHPVVPPHIAAQRPSPEGVIAAIVAAIIVGFLLLMVLMGVMLTVSPQMTGPMGDGGTSMSPMKLVLNVLVPVVAVGGGFSWYLLHKRRRRHS